MEVNLVPVTEADLELIRTWRNSEEVSKYLYTSNEISVEDQKKWFDKTRNDPTCKYWVIKADAKSIGLASIASISDTFDGCFWAFYIGDNQVRGGGIGSKVEYQILSYVFDTLKLNKLNCEVFSFNDVVIKLHEKFGFRREGYYRKHVKKNGVYHDVVALALLNDEWQSLKETLYNKIYNRDK